MSREYQIELEDELAEKRSEIARLREARWWMPWESAPKDGRWIIAVCNDGVSLKRVSWGRDRHGDLSWCGADESYGDGRSFGDGMFAGWIDCPTEFARAALAPRPPEGKGE